MQKKSKKYQYLYVRFFLRILLGTRYGPVRTRFLWFYGPDCLWF